ncbi:hypothetical protein CEN40_21280 [Fischerella thermalis CCMEE 5205]|uniref:Uncharacterized protein n=1 Tax=Fischerella thermalis CCMEE 5318 TaxID=2019666 RepID=A0A2N6LPW6_9CYAN|nr:hypothetical protein CEN47_20225 [Fischerella thermalis CCMEE 5319]PMB27910.1 hypothetical protein CEN46_00485 [Fischerella thermalis CCMEE 5318]PMB40935.1 hypothetical protein CEN40_21280 [Fischerella thermalis CCMEE 5205]
MVQFQHFSNPAIGELFYFTIVALQKLILLIFSQNFGVISHWLIVNSHLSTIIISLIFFYHP